MTGNSNRRLYFDETTKTRLYQQLSSALKKKHKHDGYNPKSTVCVMIAEMECFAEAIPESEKFIPEQQQQRRERIESLANHIDGIIEQIKALDSPALGYAINRGCEEISNIRKIANPFRSSYDAILEAEILQCSDSIKELEAFSLGIRRSVKDLPKHVSNTSGSDSPWYAQNAEMGIALALEKSFFEAGIEFTVSDKGLAAECLRATYNLGGLKLDRVDYWLKKAKKHPDSMFSLSERYKNTDQKQDSQESS